MGKDGSIVKSFRVSEEQFEKVNEIFRKEGFSVSEVIRLLFDATVREGRIPRGLSTKEMESKLDASQARECYIDGILQMAGIVPENQRNLTPKERLLKTLFNEKSGSGEMSNGELREWAEKSGLPDTLSVAALAELYDCGLFPKDIWSGAYDADIDPVTYPGSGESDEDLKSAMIVMECRDNIRDNLEQIKRTLETGAVKYLMESDNDYEKEGAQ